MDVVVNCIIERLPIVNEAEKNRDNRAANDDWNVHNEHNELCTSLLDIRVAP